MIRSVSFLLLALAAIAAPLAAQNYPGLFAVEGVSKGDILYIRDKPSTKSSIIGAFEYDEAGIEVVRELEGWGMVNSEEGIGWVSLEFLKPDEDASDLPAICFGTEPFWSVTPKRYTGSSETWIVYAPMDADASNLLTQTTTGSLKDSDKMALLAENASEMLVAVIRRQACSDGMSDRSYGLLAEFIIQSGDTLTHVSGCCSLKSPPASSR